MFCIISDQHTFIVTKCSKMFCACCFFICGFKVSLKLRSRLIEIHCHKNDALRCAFCFEHCAIYLEIYLENT